GAVPLIVHKMDANRTIPKADPDDLLTVVRRLVTARGPPQSAIRDAVDGLLTLDAVRYYLKGCDQKQINAFSTHASRYFELYLPSGSIEIAHTSRYSHKTGKSELCILATRPLMPGMVVSELKGSMADLTEEEDKELKRIGEGSDGVAIRRDFSVIHSKQLKKNHLFLGPARFVNHDCDHNVELFREGRYITFRVIKPIGVGEEVTAHYGDGYFGRKNRHCLCETCEKHGRGGYALHSSEDELSDSAAGSPKQPRGRRVSESSDSEESEHEQVDVNERRTRRGVYAVVKESEKGKEKEVPGQSGIELEAEVEPDVASELTSLGSSGASLPDPLSAEAGPSKGNGLMTPDPEPAPLTEWLASTAAAEIPTEDDVIPPSTPLTATASISATSTPTSTPSRFRSGISTRSQKARDDVSASEPPESISASMGRGRGRGRGRGGRVSSGRGGRAHVEDNSQLPTPPPTSDSSAPASVRSSSRIRNSAAGDRDTARSRLPTPLKDKAEGTTSASASTAGDKGKGREDVDPHSEARTLRPRHFHLTLEAQGKARTPAEGPRGVDGKLLPTCVTCHNVLPVIHVEGKPVWGLALGRTGKRGRPRKNVNVECPRCMRHYEIYNLKWPERHGSTAFLPTPRDTRNSTPITSANLAHLERKLNFATHGYAVPKRPYTKRKLPDAEEDPRPAKKLKVVPAATSTGKPRGRPPKKNKVGMSTKAQLILKVNGGAAKATAKTVAQTKEKETEKATEEESSRRSGRNRVPSLKLRESETPNHPRLSSRSRSRLARPVTPPLSSPSTGSALSGSESEAQAQAPQTPVKKRPEDAEVESPKVPTPKSLAVAAQPREQNGRFGRKHGKKSMTSTTDLKKRTNRVLGTLRTKAAASSGRKHDSGWESASDEDPQPSMLPQVDADVQADVAVEESVTLKRSAGEMVVEEEEESSVKKIRMEEEEDGDSADASDEEETTHFRRSLMTGAKPGLGLLRAPNPVTFARRKWATAHADPVSRVTDGSHTTDEETDLPVTPETGGEPTPTVVVTHVETDSAEEDAEPPPIMAPAPFLGKLTLKPSPMNLSRRRWAPPPPRFATETKGADSVAQKQPSEDQLDPSTRSDGYWSDEEEWGWPWTESEDDGEEEESSVVEYRAPADLSDTSAPRARAKGLTSVHSSPGSEHSVDKLTNDPPSDSSAVMSKPPAMNWKRTVLQRH
ncbi:hypothetical protein EVJ58_g7182, partial [Rhodofomes roseus]